jgi:membrane protease subunit (stomatin/prohibitin family)
MGIMDFVKGQFIDVIEYVDESNKIIVNKYNRPNNEIKQGARVIVRESQAAIFLKGGELSDILYSGTYSLNTDNLPILSTMAAFGYGFNSPIKADLYFVSLRQFVDNKWATKTPIIKRDNEFNMARIRSFGKYAFRIIDVKKFMNELFGTQGKVLTYDIIEYLASLVTESVAITIGETNMPILDLAVKYRELSNIVQKTANAKVVQMGIEFSNVVIESISLPDEVEQMIDEQSGIGMASKDMNTFMKYQTARAMRDASKQEGGLAGLGAGMALGNTMVGTISNATSSEANCKSSADQLRELKNLLDEGILTQEEFDAKKKQILGL